MGAPAGAPHDRELAVAVYGQEPRSMRQKRGDATSIPRAALTLRSFQDVRHSTPPHIKEVNAFLNRSLFLSLSGSDTNSFSLPYD